MIFFRNIFVPTFVFFNFRDVVTSGKSGKMSEEDQVGPLRRGSIQHLVERRRRRRANVDQFGVNGDWRFRIYWLEKTWNDVLTITKKSSKSKPPK